MDKDETKYCLFKTMGEEKGNYAVELNVTSHLIFLYKHHKFNIVSELGDNKIIGKVCNHPQFVNIIKEKKLK